MNEIEIIKGLLLLLKPYKVYTDELPLNYDFNLDSGIYYILDGVTDESYKDMYNLEIHIVGLDKFKLDIIKLCETLHLKLNKKEPTLKSRIIAKNVRRNYLREKDGKHHYILEYYVTNLGGV